MSEGGLAEACQLLKHQCLLERNDGAKIGSVSRTWSCLGKLVRVHACSPLGVSLTGPGT